MPEHLGQGVGQHRLVVHSCSLSKAGPAAAVDGFPRA